MQQGGVGPVLDRMLERRALSTGDQVKLVRAMTSSANESARSYLLKWLDRVKLDGHPLVKKELFQALKTLDSKRVPSTAPAAVAAAPAAPNAAPPAAAPAVLANKEGAR
jgi:hypothetical protein